MKSSAQIRSTVPVSAIIITRNERERLDACLSSLSWADEIVVVDSGSTDGTQEIAWRHTDRVFDLPWIGFGPQKQAAVDLATHDLILNVDSDERVPPELAEEIRGLLSGGLSGGDCDAWSIPRRTFLGSREIRHSGWYPDRTIRLFDRRKARFSDSQVHERVIVSGKIGACRNHLIHYSFRGFSDILRKMDRYTDLSAREMFDLGRRCRISDLTIRPAFAFIKAYLLRAGLLDGVEGLEVAVAGAVHVFVKYVKLRELEREPGEAGR